MNKIHEVRAEINKFFNPSLIVRGEHETYQSPCGKYSLEVDPYEVADVTRNWRISAAEIRDRQTNELIIQVRRNDDRFFHCWLEGDGIQYLVCSEDLEGQTVVDLTHRRIEGYCSEDDPFIWTEFYPSPDKRKLAVIGCFWACPFEVAVYDFREPMKLPLARIKRVLLPGNSSNFDKWTSHDAFSLKLEDGMIEIHQCG